MYNLYEYFKRLSSWDHEYITSKHKTWILNVSVNAIMAGKNNKGESKKERVTAYCHRGEELDLVSVWTELHFVNYFPVAVISAWCYFLTWWRKTQWQVLSQPYSGVWDATGSLVDCRGGRAAWNHNHGKVNSCRLGQAQLLSCSVRKLCKRNGI